MTPTEFQLFVRYRDASIRLDDICDKYLNLTPTEAKRRATLNTLPFPAYRLGKSQKAPFMVSLTDLAKHIDATQAKAQKEWENSQV